MGRPKGSKNQKTIQQAAKNSPRVETSFDINGDVVQVFRCARQGVASIASIKTYGGKVLDKELWPYSFSLDDVQQALLNLQKKTERLIG